MKQPFSPTRLRFGVFEFDPLTSELRKKGSTVRLGQHPLKILGLLLEHPGRLRTREEIRRLLWDSVTFVNFEQSTNKAVYQLREALGDLADNPRYIETVAGTGYRFIYFAEEASRLNQGSTRRLPTIVVLPFRAGESDAELDLLRKRIVNWIIDVFSGETAIRVFPYTTVEHHSKDNFDPERVGQDLLADVVIGGEIIRQRDELYIHAELIDVSTGSQLWGAEFREAYSDASGHPEKIASRICGQLRPMLARKLNLTRKEPFLVVNEKLSL